MKFKKKVKSKVDKTIKYIFETEDKQIVEYSYIDNNSNKDIICVPCQTMCNMSCKFCHLTDHIGKISLKDLSGYDINEGVKHIVDDLDLGHRTLLISYMGCGEPLDNIEGVWISMYMLNKEYGDIRFGMATMLPKNKWEAFTNLTKRVKENNIPLKIHLSLHFTDDKLRKEWMPAALDIKPSIDLLCFYSNLTGLPIEVHYTIMDGVNDDFDYAAELELLLRCTDVTIKFMRFSEKESLDVKEASMVSVGKIMHYLEDCGFDVEYYEPPGVDIGASCGQFLLDVGK